MKFRGGPPCNLPATTAPLLMEEISGYRNILIVLDIYLFGIMHGNCLDFDICIVQRKCFVFCGCTIEPIEVMRRYENYCKNMHGEMETLLWRS